MTRAPSGPAATLLLVTLCLTICLAGIGGCGTGEEAVSPPARRAPDIVLITIDTVRADHLSAYGYARTTTPSIDRLAESGVLFERAASQAPWTLPSMASIHTSLLPSQHGAVHSSTPLPQSHATLAEVLARAGYRTAAVVSHVFVGPAYGFDRGFEVFDDSLTVGHDGITSRALSERALVVYQGRYAPNNAEDDPRPTFLWVHYFDPHYSYLRHPEFAFAVGESGRFQRDVHLSDPAALDLEGLTDAERHYMMDVFDEELAHTDRWIGALVAGMQHARRGRPLQIILTADHGEAFLDHGRLAHGRDLYDELIRVPLVITGDLPAALRGRRVPLAVETAWIGATVAGMAGIAEHPFRGSDLLAIARGELRPGAVYAEGSYARGFDGRKRSVERDGFKLIHHLDDDRHQLFDLVHDPAEQRDLAGDAGQATRMAELKKLLEVLPGDSAPTTPAAGAADATPPQLSSQDRARLRALGYLGDESPAPAPGDPD